MWKLKHIKGRPTGLPLSTAVWLFSGARAALIWDSKISEVIGLLTITDFIRILLRFTERKEMREERSMKNASPSSREKVKRGFEENEIAAWKGIALTSRQYSCLSL